MAGASVLAPLAAVTLFFPVLGAIIGFDAALLPSKTCQPSKAQPYVTSLPGGLAVGILGTL
jgi:hypothetical protein